MKIKICGITRLEDARFCAGAGADYLGFIQQPESPRYVTPTTAKEIVSWVYGPSAVGVFVDEEIDLVNEVSREVGFDTVQLHGEESPEYCAEMAFPVIKALRVFPETSVAELERTIERYADTVAHFLLDTGKSGVPGGTGTTFAWQKAVEIAETYPIFLAGGLTPSNVGRALEIVRPYAVDTSSGVESGPGIKDVDLLSQYFEAIRSIEA